MLRRSLRTGLRIGLVLGVGMVLVTLARRRSAAIDDRDGTEPWTPRIVEMRVGSDMTASSSRRATIAVKRLALLGMGSAGAGTVKARR